MSRPVRARRLTDDEGQFLLRLIRRRGRADAIRYRRGLIILASSSGTPVLAIARLIAADPDTVRDVIHAFNAHGLSVLEPHWGAGRPPRITDQDEAFVVEIARRRPGKLGLPFTHWSIRKLANYLSGRYGRTDPAQMPHRIVRIGRERVRRILHSHDITFQRTRTWKESRDPAKDAKLDRIEEVMSRFPDRVFAFDQFGPLSIRPCHGTCWARTKHPDRLPATYHRYHGVRYFHGCYDLARDQLWGVLHEHKGGAHTLAALNSIRAARPDGAPIYIVCDILSSQHHCGDPDMGSSAQGRAVPDPDERQLGRPDRGAVRAPAHVHDGQLRPPQPRRPGPPTTRLPALAQRQRPRPAGPGRPAPRTRPRPQRERPPLGTAPALRRLTNPVIHPRQRTSDPSSPL
jgi:transposase